MHSELTFVFLALVGPTVRAVMARFDAAVAFQPQQAAVVVGHVINTITIGRVGCGDASVGTHARVHPKEEPHPVIPSFDFGGAWSWCFEEMRTG